MRGKTSTDKSLENIYQQFPDDRPPLTGHERLVARYLMGIEGFLPGFPDNKRKFENVVRAIAEFASTKPRTHSSIAKGEVQVIPAEWLMGRIREKCQFWPAMCDIRKIYWDFFPCEDGVEPQELITTRRRSAASEE